ncbi:hypothetical protein P154DRAFT_609092 [Amniculicola lignicola CBS 123094]|uniref:F-box domain-containing protein n=1 Tax=Amniculicola lignicola CBS 123094 TaxID=1392246 RepID=A0A6A5W6E2_9PLEO|nr:hypothetical protein P154DRAFT_609092 [Amniculicola lignicola CBS 123094]
MDPDLPFRFLDLPRELRLMVYEYIPIQKSHLHYQTSPGKSGDAMKVMFNSICGLSILRTCRSIYDEAMPILRKLLSTLESEPIRLIIKSRDLKGPLLRYFLLSTLPDIRKGVNTPSTLSGSSFTVKASLHFFRKVQRHMMFMETQQTNHNMDIHILIEPDGESSGDLAFQIGSFMGYITLACILSTPDSTFPHIHLDMLPDSRIDMQNLWQALPMQTLETGTYEMKRRILVKGVDKVAYVAIRVDIPQLITQKEWEDLWVPDSEPKANVDNPILDQ